MTALEQLAVRMHRARRAMLDSKRARNRLVCSERRLSGQHYGCAPLCESCQRHRTLTQTIQANRIELRSATKEFWRTAARLAANPSKSEAGE